MLHPRLRPSLPFSTGNRLITKRVTASFELAYIGHYSTWLGRKEVNIRNSESIAQGALWLRSRSEARLLAC